MQKIATFIGHSRCYDIDITRLREAIETLVKQGVSEFLCGGMGAFDNICASTVKGLKKEYNVKITLVIPYLSFQILNPEYYDEILYPEGFEKYHFKAAIGKRNRYMVEKSSVAVCYVNSISNGAGKTYEYAKKQNVEIINLGKYKGSLV